MGLRLPSFGPVGVLGKRIRLKTKAYWNCQQPEPQTRRRADP